MSSILDALRKFEASEAPTAPEVPAWTAPPRQVPWLAIGLMLAFGAGVALTLWLRAGGPVPAARPVEPVASAPAPQPAPTVAAAAAPQMAAVTPPPAPATPEPPPVAAPPLALAPAAPAPPLPQAVVDAAPPVGHITAPTPAAPPTAEVEVAARPPEPPPDGRPAADAVLPRPPAGAPNIKLSFLVYSRVPARRTVALSVDGSLVTLHEGESSHGVEVQRILADRVELRHGGQAFAVRAGD